MKGDHTRYHSCLRRFAHDNDDTATPGEPPTVRTGEPTRNLQIRRMMSTAYIALLISSMLACSSNPILFPAQDIFLFQHMSKKQIADVVRVISREQVREGDVVIKQGDQGEKFYIVDAGEFDVSPYCTTYTLAPMPVSPEERRYDCGRLK